MGYRVTVWVVLVVLAAEPAMSQDSLRLLTWNIQMLPFPAKAPGKGKRAKAIVEILKTQPHDIIVFQEAFKRRSRRILRKGLRAEFPHQTDVLNQKTFSIKTNGGVMIFSRHAIDSIYQIRFQKRTGFDKYARKGALLAEINVNGRRVQILGTHLQAFGTDDVLFSQYHQVRNELLHRHARPGVPQFLLGDFNTRKAPAVPPTLTAETPNPQTRYHFMLQTLEASDGDLQGDQQYTMDRPYNDMCITRKEARLLLDYILVRSDADLPATRRVKIFRKPWHKDHQDLSDHFAVEATIPIH